MQTSYFRMVAISSVIIVCLLALVSCQSNSEPTPSATPIASPSPSPSPQPSAGAKPTATPAGVEATDSPSPQPITVSKEVFTQTFSEVELLIKALNEIIKKKDFAAWTKYLSEPYRKRMSQPDYLQVLNQSAILQKNNITLKSIEDYFNFVVVPSRANLRLDDLVFLKETEVEAIMVVGNRRVTLYRLIKIGDQWLIGLS